MKRNGFLTWFVLASIVLAGLACSLPAGFGGIGSPQPTSSSETAIVQDNTVAPTTIPKTTAIPATAIVKATAVPATATLSPTAKGPNPYPVPLRQGLASLNSYTLKIKIVNNGPTKTDRNENTTRFEVNTKNDSVHTHTDSVSSSADDPTLDSSSSDSYQVGLKSCQVTLSSSTPTGILTDENPLGKDIATTLSYLMDYSISPENPVFAGEETINNVATNHFTFKTSHIGKDSGAVVNKNDGEYWIAKDGQYLVKYSVILELSSDKAGTQLVHSEFTLELSAINQPVNISIPAYCKN